MSITSSSMNTANDRPFLSYASRKTVLRGSIAFLGAFIITAAGTTAFSLSRWLPGPSVKQPVAFNHDKHTRELELGCTTCHRTVETEAFSGMPGVEVCAACHEEALGNSGEEKKLVALLKAGTPLSWQPLFRQPSHVFYSHRRHVVSAKIACDTCHGAMAASTTPPGRVHKLAMADCMECHRHKGGPTDCTGCHR